VYAIILLSRTACREVRVYNLAHAAIKYRGHRERIDGMMPMDFSPTPLKVKIRYF